jgi:hypothetical protein
MQPHPRIRKTIKWGGAAVTLLLVVVWIWSGWWWARVWTSPFSCLTAHCGRLLYGYPDIDDFSGPPTLGRYHDGGFHLAWSWYRGDVDFAMPTIGVPLWPFACVALLTTVTAWRLDTLARRRAHTHCPKCNYDRAGIAKDAACPECGALATAI